MKILKIGLSIISAFIIGGLCAWFLRGEYDKQFMTNGHFHVISTAKKEHNVVIMFPSGVQKSFILKKDHIFDFKEPNTGEGSITVSIDGVIRDQLGYVTYMNPMTILVIDENQTQLSQIFPSLNTETTVELNH